MIISASRRTDIPTYFSHWFFQRIREGYVLVRNPVNFHQVSKVNLSPEAVDCIVFWTKNPGPMLDHMNLLQDYSYYFQFTVTSYGADMEKNVPSKRGEVIDTFQRLSHRIGKERVIWRYDPIFINETYSMEYHVRYFEKLARQLKEFTETCTISFLDDYPGIRSNLASMQIRPPTVPEILELAKPLSEIARENGLKLNACSEEMDLTPFGILPASCIDAALIQRIVGYPILAGKDPNQRPACGCAASVDIGAYNTCGNGCGYCYANHSKTAIMKHMSQYEKTSPLLCSRLVQEDKVTERAVHSSKTSQLCFL